MRKIWYWLIALFMTLAHNESGAFTLVGWQESLDEDGVLSNVAACSDQHVAVSGDRIYVPPLNKLVAEYAAQANTVTHAQLQSPSLRRVCLLDIAMVQGGGYPSGGESFYPHFDCPIGLEVNEGLEALMNKPADGAIVATVLAWLADNPLVPVVGEMFTIKVTATITSIVGQWVNGALTFTQTLPVGKYAIVGAKFGEFGGDVIAFRFVVAGYGWRAGGLACGDLGARPHALQRYGGMGVWCEFDSTTPPTLDILAYAAASQSVVGYIDLIKTG
jgi:hypothetical protein